MDPRILAGPKVARLRRSAEQLPRIYNTLRPGVLGTWPDPDRLYEPGAPRAEPQLLDCARSH